MGWEEPGPLLAILNTAVKSTDLQEKKERPRLRDTKRVSHFTNSGVTETGQLHN